MDEIDGREHAHHGAERHRERLVPLVRGHPGARPQLTANGYLLASKMATLPPAKVARVLDAAWPTWLNWHTTDAQLAGALGIRAPSITVPALPTKHKPGVRIVQPTGPIPISPVCTS
jgi:hypothetical protein